MYERDRAMEYTKMLAENIVNTTYEDLPQDVIEKTKRHILDILGVMLPPSRFEKGCKILEEIAREGGGKEESTLIGFGGKVPCWMAAFVNGSLCHPMDYDDTIDEFPNHPSSHAFPAAFAIAEKVGNVSGKEFLTAVALAVDLTVRLSAAPTGRVGEDYPWFSVPIFGVFSATAAGGKLLGLNVEEMINAFGISVDRVFGITESLNSPDSEMRAIRDGFGNREGVLAALMVKKGFTACKNPIEILYKVFYNNDYDPSILVSNLGQEFWGLKVGLKAWPCCRVAHTYVRAALDIVGDHTITAENIDEILLTVGKFGRDYLFTPLEVKQRPRRSIQAKLSLPFVMGVVFAKRRVIIEDFLEENLADPKVLEIAKKTKYKYDRQISEDAIGAGIVEVKTKDGKSIEKKEDIPYGNPKNPMSDEELIKKFKDCAHYSNKPLGEDKIARLMSKILGLEKLENMKEISEILA
jgi:2-methylcitrate dehydratase PrpD